MASAGRSSTSTAWVRWAGAAQPTTRASNRLPGCGICAAAPGSYFIHARRQLRTIVMAKNYKFPGAVIDIVAASALVSGQASIVGQLLAVALVDIPAGSKGSAQIEGVFELPKLASANIAAGAGLTWDAQGGQLIVAGADAGDLENCAVAIAVAGSGTATVLAKLTPGSGSVKSA
ncbi:hypothetical protein C1931_13605 [Stenotrophomonas sp. YAU14A_MKIMI4_1]|nr:hypothetical protein C1931_13605 [Stenotrophomonas sp. YAU14A_MKIMI4_1]